MPQWIGINYTTSIPGEPSITLLPDSSSATLTIDVAWDNHRAVGSAFIGRPEYTTLFERGDPTKPVNVILRHTPFKHPDFSWMFCTGVQRITGVAPRGTTRTTGPKFQLARCVLQCQSLPYSVVEDSQTLGYKGLPDESRLLRYVSKTTKQAGRYLTIPRGAMQSADARNADAPVFEGIPKQIPMHQIEYTWYDIPRQAIPRVAIEKCYGAINSAEFDGYQAETLLLTGVEYEPHVSPLGLKTAHVKYSLLFHPNIDEDDGSQKGHNYLLMYLKAQGGQPAKVRPVLVKSNGTTGGNEIYRKEDFTTLFRPDQP